MFSNKWKFEKRCYEQSTGDEGGGNKAPAQAQAPAPAPAPAPTEKVIFTPEQQEHIDRLLAAQFAKVQTKAEKKLDDIKQAEKLKNLSAEDRANEELRIARAQLQAYEAKELSSQFKVELSGKGLPQEFAEFLNITDADQAQKAVTFLSGYKTKIEAEYKEKIKTLETEVNNSKLRGPAPKAPLPSGGGTLLDQARKAAGLK